MFDAGELMVMFQLEKQKVFIFVLELQMENVQKTKLVKLNRFHNFPLIT